MKLHVLGIDLGKTVFSFGWAGFNWQSGDPQAMPVSSLIRPMDLLHAFSG